MAALVVPAYLAAGTAPGGSGSSRDEAGWEYARSLLAEAAAPGAAFLDVGCANGHLMESMAAWAGVEPYGLEISPELAELARRRLPHWAERIWVGNAPTGHRRGASTSCGRGSTTCRRPIAASSSSVC